MIQILQPIKGRESYFVYVYKLRTLCNNNKPEIFTTIKLWLKLNVIYIKEVAKQVQEGRLNSQLYPFPVMVILFKIKLI